VTLKVTPPRMREFSYAH